MTEPMYISPEDKAIRDTKKQLKSQMKKKAKDTGVKYTAKQEALVDDLNKTFDPALSVKRIYGKDIPKHGGVTKILTSAGVKALMNSKSIGLDDTTLLTKAKAALNATKWIWDKTVKGYVEVPDWMAILKALELSFRIKGYLAPDFSQEAEEKYKQITVNFNLVKARDTDEVKKLLGDMPSITIRDTILQGKEPEPQPVPDQDTTEGEVIDG